MTPAARVAAAITVLEDWLAGEPVEKALTGWGRANRYAGSSDRAAIRDHVFQAMRCRLSHAFLGGGLTGRGLMIGQMRDAGVALDEIFSGEKFAPAALSAAEMDAPDLADAPEHVRLDWPDWLLPEMAGYGAAREAICLAMRDRAPVFLRVNLLRASVEDAAAALAAEQIETRLHPLSPTALEVLTHPRRVAQSRAYQDGLVELQDAASQAAVDLAGAAAGQSVLDYCAGGGGKALALAAQTGVRVDAHDANARRMRDLPARAARAGAEIRVLEHVPKGALYDLVFCDVPCSGSGSWRRDPDGKWALTPEVLADLAGVQRDILERAQAFVKPGGRLVYATCSLFARENDAVVDGFAKAHPEFAKTQARQFTPLDGGDGFYACRLERR